MIHFFNPGHESAVLNSSKYYTPPANIVALQQDLSFLPAWYAKSNDWIYTQNTIPFDFIGYIENNLYPIAKPIDNSIIESNLNIINEKLELWGLSQHTIHLFSELSAKHNLNLELPIWNDKYRDLCSRETAKQCLEFIVSSSEHFSENLIPAFFNSLEDINSYIEEHSDFQYLAKAPYSSSGRGLLWLPIGGLTRTEKQILHGMIKKQKAVSIEKVLNKKLDFAMEFSVKNDSINYEGLSLFETNSKGSYTGNILANQSYIQQEITQYINKEILLEARELIFKFIQNNISLSYEGYIGVDMMLYEEDGIIKLNPCVEINLRNNMGILSIHLSKKVLAENCKGRFQIDFSPANEEQVKRHKEMIEKHPAIFENNRLSGGYLALCPVSATSKYRAYILLE